MRSIALIVVLLTAGCATRAQMQTLPVVVEPLEDTVALRPQTVQPSNNSVGIIQVAGDRFLVWDYLDLAIACPWIDDTDESLGHDVTTNPGCVVERFEVWGEVDPTNPDADNAWLDAGIVPGPFPDSYQYLLPTGLTYRFVRACNEYVCGNWAALLRPSPPTNLRLYTEP